MFDVFHSFDIHRTINWRDILDVLIITFIIYKGIMLIKGTRALATLLGLGLLIVLYFISLRLELYAVQWFLEYIVGSLFIVLIILFQKDIRQALGEMGARYFWGKSTLRHDIVEEIVLACTEMARLRMGALIIIQRSLPLKDMVRQEGVAIDAIISKKLLMTLFWEPCPLHDGAVIIINGRLSAASCILPLAVVKDKNFGTRHRAAIGITEETDALAIVVSEERGEISVALKGSLVVKVTPAKLREMINDAL